MFEWNCQKCGKKLKANIVWVSLLIVFIYQFSLISPINATETITLEPMADATVCNAAESGNNTELKVGRLYGVAWVTYIMFDLSNIPTDAIVESVKLKLKSKTFFLEGNKYVRALNSSTEWIEDEITWDNKPERDRWLDTEWVELIHEWYVWDCTWALTSKREKLSIALELSSGMDGYVMFYSRESEYKPQLEVKYSPPSKIDPTITAITTVVGIIGLIGVLYLVYYLWKKGFFRLQKVRRTTETHSV
ncbi:MAG: DNRLRE domain-containing protein [Candidatus Bathycorpusculaceae bacterium]